MIRVMNEQAGHAQCSVTDMARQANRCQQEVDSYE